MWKIELVLGSRVHRGTGATPTEAWHNIPDGRRLDPNIQMGYGQWVRDAEGMLVADPALSTMTDINKYSGNRATLTFEP